MSNNSKQKGIIAWFTVNNVAANLLLISVIILGILSVSQLRKEAFPSLEPSNITVAVSYNSGDPEQAEEGITLKIEEALEGVDGIKGVTSRSTANGVSINIEKESGYDLDLLTNDVRNEIDSINNLPSNADRPIITKQRRGGRAIFVQLYGDADQKELQDIAVRLKADLLQKSEISKISVSYELDPVISIEIDQTTLKSYNLSLSDIETAINQESGVSFSTSLRNGDKTVKIKGRSQFNTLEEFSQIPVITNMTGAIIRLSDIASITRDFDEDDFILNLYNKQNGITLELRMGENSDIMKISDSAREVVEKWKSNNYLPDNIKITTWNDGSETIKSRLSLLVKNALTGILMVFVILAIFLNIQVAFWVAAGIPFVFLGTLFFMTDSFTDLTINVMTTFGFIMALGIVVDDAVVVGESIYETRRIEGDKIDSTIIGVKKVAVPTIFGVLTTVVSFLALSQVEGTLGQIFAQFGTVVALCLLLSVVESKLILPSHLASINTHKKESKWNPLTKIQHGADKGLEWFKNKIYIPLIDFSLQTKFLVLMIFISIIIGVGSMPLTGKLRISFFPSIPSDEVTANLTMLQDASYNQTYKNLIILQDAAYAVDKELIAKNTGERLTEITSMYVSSNSDTGGEVIVSFYSNPNYTSTEFSNAWIARTQHLEGRKKLSIRASRRMVDNFNIELKSIDGEAVKESGQDIRQYLEGVDGVSSIEDNLTEVVAQYKVEVTNQGRALGFTPSTLSLQLLRTFGGGSVQKFQENNNEVTVNVRYPKENRQTLTDILNVNVITPDGNSVPVTAVANIISTYQESSLTRIDSQKATFVSATVDKDILSSNELVDSVKKNVVAQLEIRYPQLNVTFSGEAEEQKESLDSLKLVFFGALIGIYALLAIPLKSYIQPLLIMTAIPFGIIGAILGHWITGLQLSILSLFGILALSGVVVNDSLLLVSRFNELRNKVGMNVHDAIVKSCAGRLRAVILTSATTFAGLIPLLSETSRNAQFLKPAAASLAYGIVFATVITLILIPILLMINENIKDFFIKIKNKYLTFS
jgi:multidrug efflux pump subunit AcrB